MENLSPYLTVLGFLATILYVFTKIRSEWYTGTVTKQKIANTDLSDKTEKVQIVESKQASSSTASHIFLVVSIVTCGYSVVWLLFISFDTSPATNSAAFRIAFNIAYVFFIAIIFLFGTIINRVVSLLERFAETFALQKDIDASVQRALLTQLEWIDKLVKMVTHKNFNTSK